MAAPRPYYGRNVVGRRLKMLRSDGLWHECIVGDWNAASCMHQCDWVGDSGAVTPGDWYDCNHPLRSLRWYEDGEKEGTLGALLPEHVLPVSVPLASPPVKQLAEATAAQPVGKPQYSQKTLSTGTTMITSLSSGSHYVVRPSDKAYVRIVIPAATPAAALSLATALAATAEAVTRPESATILASAADALGKRSVAAQPCQPALAPCVPGGWPALHAMVAAERLDAAAPAVGAAAGVAPSAGGGGRSLLFARVRIFWPADHRWYAGRVLRFDPSSGQHLVRYDDGDERWYPMDAKQFVVVPPYGAEAVGRKLAIEVAAGKWMAATLQAYEPDLGCHRVTYDDYPGDEEYADLGARDMQWLVNVRALAAGERVLGRRVSVFWSRYTAFFSATVTLYTPRVAGNTVLVSPTGTTVLADSADGRGAEGASVGRHGFAASAGSSGVPVSPSLRGKAAAVLTPPIEFEAEEEEEEAEDGSAWPSSGSDEEEKEEARRGGSSQRVKVQVAAAPKKNGHATAAVVEAESADAGRSSSSSSSSSAAAVPPPVPVAHPRRMGRLPSYVPVEVAPDVEASVRIVYDNGDKETSQLCDLRFAWLDAEMLLLGEPPGGALSGTTGLLNMGNTCYLNAVLQCLSHVEQLTAYVLDESFNSSINSRNASGMGGRMAIAFADLLQQLWGRGCPYTLHDAPAPAAPAALARGDPAAPKAAAPAAGNGAGISEPVLAATTGGSFGGAAFSFVALPQTAMSGGPTATPPLKAVAPCFVKALLSERSSVFNGMGQQDAHEALMCLLDGLHEDLSVPDHAASAAAASDAQVAAEEDAAEDRDKRSRAATAAAFVASTAAEAVEAAPAATAPPAGRSWFSMGLASKPNKDSSTIVPLSSDAAYPVSTPTASAAATSATPPLSLPVLPGQQREPADTPAAASLSGRDEGPVSARSSASSASCGGDRPFTTVDPSAASDERSVRDSTLLRADSHRKLHSSTVSKLLGGILVDDASSGDAQQQASHHRVSNASTVSKLLGGIVVETASGEQQQPALLHTGGAGSSQRKAVSTVSKLLGGIIAESANTDQASDSGAALAATSTLHSRQASGDPHHAMGAGLPPVPAWPEASSQTHADVDEDVRGMANIVNPLVAGAAAAPPPPSSSAPLAGAGGGGVANTIVVTAAQFEASKATAAKSGDDAAGSNGSLVSPAVRRPPPVETTSIVKQLLFVHMQTELVCARHKHVTVRHGPRGGEMLPPLPLVPRISSRTGGFFRRRTVVRDPQLADCLDGYFAPEAVERRCDKCAAMPGAAAGGAAAVVAAAAASAAGGSGGAEASALRATTPMTHRCWLTALPPVLVVQLKRFEYQPAANSYVKLNDPVGFPLRDLDMSPYVRGYDPRRHGPSRYDLMGVVVHMGTPDRGHYTAYARSLSAATTTTVSGTAVAPAFAPGAAAAGGAAGGGGAGVPPPAGAGVGTRARSSSTVLPSAAASAAAGAAAASTTSDPSAAPPVTVGVGGSPPAAAAVGSTPAAGSSPSAPACEAQWYYYDDSTVTAVTEDEISHARVSCLAYLLFYIRRLPPRAALLRAATAPAPSAAVN